MNESIMDSPNVPKMELSHEGDNSTMAANKRHSENDATAFTAPIAPTATATVATATAAIQRMKRQFAPEISVEGQQNTSSESNEPSVKQPRLDLADRQAASDPQVPPPTSIMSSSQHALSLYPRSHLNEAKTTSTLPSLRENRELGLILDQPPFPHPSQLPPPYQHWSPSPLAAQSSTDFECHDSGSIPVNLNPNDNEEPDTPLSPWNLGPATVTNAPAFPPQSIPPSEASQQMPSSEDPVTDRHQSQTSTPQSFLDGSLGASRTYSEWNNGAGTPDTPSANSIEKQTRQFGSISLTFSKPAQADDLDPFSMEQRRLITAYAKTEQGKNDEFFMQWHSGIRQPFWAQMVTSFGGGVPASIYQEVVDELCASHPCIIDPWTGHGLYKKLVGDARVKSRPMARLYTLKDWMYGAGTTTHTTWRDALRSKVGQDKNVPWVKRAKIIALSVILSCAEAALRERVSAQSTKAAKNVRPNKLEDHLRKLNFKKTAGALSSKHDILAACKLTYLLSDQDQVVADAYWDGFAEELEHDPKQEHLYDKVMQANQSLPPGNTATWPSLPTNGQDAQGWEEQNHRHSGGQEGLSWTGDFQTATDAGAQIPQYSENHEPTSVAQLSLLLVEDPNQETEHIQSPASQEMSLQDRVQQLEGQVTEMHRYIELMHQHFPGFLARPPWASSQHQP